MKHKISNKEMLALFGGNWPDTLRIPKRYSDFSFSSVDHWEVDEDGIISPFLGGTEMDGPSFRLRGLL